MIRLAKLSDAAAVADIYNYYIKETVITFEVEPVSAEQMRERIAKVLERKRWFVFEEDGIVVGYAYAGQWRERAAYKETVETSVMVFPRGPLPTGMWTRTRSPGFGCCCSVTT
mgnify:CR=1 FL=1